MYQRMRHKHINKIYILQVGLVNDMKELIDLFPQIFSLLIFSLLIIRQIGALENKDYDIIFFCK